MTIVERIKAKCKEKSTTMGTLEKELGFGNGNIRRWDERTPGADRIFAVAQRLGVTVEWLLTGKEAGELTPEEQRLVDLYRSCSETGQDIIMENARSMQLRFPAEREPAGVSVSETG